MRRRSTLFDFGEHEGVPYIAMELLEGETLRERLRRGPFALDEALSLARDLLCGLRSAHDLGIVHRDLKPENVVLVPDKHRGFVARLLDFGIARLRDRGPCVDAGHDLRRPRNDIRSCSQLMRDHGRARRLHMPRTSGPSSGAGPSSAISAPTIRAAGDRVSERSDRLAPLEEPGRFRPSSC